MPLYLHLSIHFLLAYLLGAFTGRYSKYPWLCLIAAILGGFLIDLDHVLEYLVVYGLNFNLTYFFEGRQFLTKDTIWIWFHAWEYLPILLFFAWLARKKARALAVFLVVLASAAFIHMVSDVLINKYPPRFYSLIYRQQVDFSAARLLPPTEYLKNLEYKNEYGL